MVQNIVSDVSSDSVRRAGLSAQDRRITLRSNLLVGYTLPLGFPVRPSLPRVVRGSAYTKVMRVRNTHTHTYFRLYYAYI